jgi:hypothetical protein
LKQTKRNPTVEAKRQVVNSELNGTNSSKLFGAPIKDMSGFRY